MAFVTIKDAKVDRIIEGYGFVAINTYTDKSGVERTERFTIWSKENAPTVGSMVNVEGRLSVKVDEFTNQAGELIRYAATHVNDPKVTSVALEDMPF